MKVLVSDYDQTFYLYDEDIKRNIMSINEFRKKENLFIIATGRSYESIKSEINKYDIKYDYLIINHGATILDNNDNILFNFSMPDNLKNDIVKDLSIDKMLLNVYSSKLKDEENSKMHDVTRIHGTYLTKEDMIKDYNKIKEKYCKNINIYIVTEKAFEIITNKTSKLETIELLMDKLNIKKEDIYVIGDGYSDIDMVNYYNGYAMKNSVDELQKICKNKIVNSVSDLIKIIKE